MFVHFLPKCLNDEIPDRQKILLLHLLKNLPVHIIKEIL